MQIVVKVIGILDYSESAHYRSYQEPWYHVEGIHLFVINESESQKDGNR